VHVSARPSTRNKRTAIDMYILAQRIRRKRRKRRETHEGVNETMEEDARELHSRVYPGRIMNQNSIVNTQLFI